MAKTPLPFGTWPSPITPELAAKGSRRFGMVQAVDGFIYWSEGRPEQAGRQTIMRVRTGVPPEEILPAPHSARSRVHEYGGGEFLVASGNIYFVNDMDQEQDIYVFRPSGPKRHEPRRITRARKMRFADLDLDTARKRLLAVAETHDGRGMPRNTLVAIALDSRRRGRVTELAAGRDFYSTPRLSHDGKRLAFLAWDLPDMPWDSAELYLADVREDGTLGRPHKIAGGNGSAVFQPEWLPEGSMTLTFVSDETGWGALYTLCDGKISRVHSAANADLSRPQWAFGMRSYAVTALSHIYSVFLERGVPLLKQRQLFHVVHPRPRDRTRRDLQQRGVTRIDYPSALGGMLAATIGTPTGTPAMMTLSGNHLIGVQAGRAPAPDIPPDCVSAGAVRRFRRGRNSVFGIYYAPTNPMHRGPRDRLPPALVLAHGGPTSMVDATLNPRVQYYTSRGFAVFDVNYSGSTGYGREYRRRLDGQWGIADVADCAAAARHLAAEGLADASRIAIAGGSAGGYTVLMALATTDAFAAGSSHYGISDLALLMADTHKFESGYLHRLLGTTPDDWRDVCAARSPINLIEGIKSPLILFQGLDDKVVPPEQSRRIAGQLKSRGIPVEYHEFAGEAHGFRKAETIIAVLRAELAFLLRALRLG